MSTSIAYMTKKEFTQLLSNVVEQKLTELFGDLDDDRLMKENHD